MAIVAYFDGSVDEYQVRMLTWVEQVRPACCPHCHVGVCILWGSYARWVYTDTDRIRIRIERVMCVVCGVSAALLPSFVHPFRRYTLSLIQRAISLALLQGVWGQALVDAIGPYHQPAPATLREWVCSFAQTAATWLLAWLSHTLAKLDPLLDLDPGPPPAHLLAIAQPERRQAFIQGWQALCLMEMLYAAVRSRQLDLIFEAHVVFAFVLAYLGLTHRIPRLLWPQVLAQAP